MEMGSQARSPWWPRGPDTSLSLSLRAPLGGKQLTMTWRASRFKGRDEEMTQGAENSFKSLIGDGSAGPSVSCESDKPTESHPFRTLEAAAE